MSSLKYKIIKSRKQYKDYNKTLESLLDQESSSRAIMDEIDLLTLLILDVSKGYVSEILNFKKVSPKSDQKISGIFQSETGSI